MSGPDKPDTAEAPGSCGGHAGLGSDIRGLAVAALDRLEPALDRLRSGEADPADPAVPATCAVCPVCAVLAALRGERSELAVRLADQAAGLLAVARAALEEGAGAPGPGPGDGADPAARARRPVQHIPVSRG